MATKVQIDDRWIGNGEPCFIIAEAGSNHNANFELARQLIDTAASAGADAVKFQVFRASRLYPKSAGQSDYLSTSKPIYDIMAEMETPYEWLPELAAYSRKKKLVFLASVFDEESADQLDPYVSAFKIASYEMTHLPLVRYVAKKGKPMIISTGTANLREVEETVEEVHAVGNNGMILMQCTAAYPAPVESLNIRAIASMKEKFHVPVGLSDHSRDPVVGPIMAIAIGANLIEKHFTLNNMLPGPDHRFALEPSELKTMIQKVRVAEKALGNGEKVMHPVEAELRGFARRSIFAVRDIKAGEEFTSHNVAVLRCGKLTPGLEPKYFETILSRHAIHNIRANSAIQSDDYD